jgi:hypothetical protein
MYNELEVFKQFKQIIVWGFPLHTHTHSYIHAAWVKTFKYIGLNVFWFHDKDYPKDFDYSNSCFITEGWADDNIPLNNTSTYFVHIARNPSKYLSVGARLIEIRYNVLEIHDFNYDYRLPESGIHISHDTIYEKLSDDHAVALKRGRNISQQAYEVVYMYWATDLLPHEINYSDASNEHSKDTIYYIGSLGENHPFYDFYNESIKRGFKVGYSNPWNKPISNEDNINLMKLSYCAPDFRSNGDRDKFIEYGKFNGTNHLDIGYIPCRVFKAISYGQTGITNSLRVKKILGDYVEYAKTPSKVFDIVEKRKNDVEWRKSCMKYISENHTFLQRVRDLARVLRIKSETTCVSAIYDIGREKIDGRSIGDYKKYLFNTLSTIKVPFVLYMDSRLDWEEDIYKLRSSIGPIQIIKRNLSEIPMWKYRDSVKNIMNSEKFKSSLKYPNDITNLLPEYVLIQYSKFSWLEDTFKTNPFSSVNCIWIDAGLSRFYKSNTYTITSKPINKFLIQVDNTISRLPSLSYDNYIGTNERIFHGGLWNTDKESLIQVKSEVMRIWEDEMLGKGRYDNEQITLALAYKNISSSFGLTTNSIFNEIFRAV